ncbi:hypothetical protein [Nitrosomonas oligotropha]|uniref:hypothetical protein n=1 Tax=Nitrosomonas oligotropha TaxID=42354 RepID=UPI000B7CB7B3|nr:hypothetical protein [Nitrosomonas oligotropha]
MENTDKIPDQYLDNDAEQPMIDLSTISLEKMEFMKEIAAMDKEKFHAKAGAIRDHASARWDKNKKGLRK